jgi:hypothetical protein
MSDFRPPIHVTLAFCAGAVGSGILSTVPSICLIPAKGVGAGD